MPYFETILLKLMVMEEKRSWPILQGVDEPSMEGLREACSGLGCLGEIDNPDEYHKL